MKKSIKVIAAAALMSMAMAMPVMAEEGGIVIIDPGTQVPEITYDDSTVIQAGIYFGDTSVGGMTVEQARKVINDYVASVGDMTLRLTSQTTYTDFPVSELSPACNNSEHMIATAVGVKHVGSLISQYKQAKDLECTSLHIDYDISFSMDNVMSYISDNSDIFQCEPKNASVQLNDNGSFTVIHAVEGFSVNYDETFDSIKAALNSCDLATSVITCEVAGETTKPAFGDEVFEGFGDLLGEGSTEYRTDGSQKDRATNVRVGTTRINGTILMPGEQFSYINSIQPFSEAGGYKKAGTYTPSGTSYELGGGLCQVSTTLYNACLWAELQIDFRRPHSRTVDYVPYSMDAMIYVLGGQDYKFSNNTGHAIYIQSYYTTIGTGKEKITFKIYGTEYRPENRTIDYVSTTDSTWTTDPPYLIQYDSDLNIYPDFDAKDPEYYYYTQAHIGAKSHLNKEIYIDGVLVSSTLVNSDQYKASQGTFTINPKTIIIDLGLDDVLGIAHLKLGNPYEKTTSDKTTEDETTSDETTKSEETTTQESTTQAPTTQAPTEPPTEAPTDPPTQAPTEPPTEPPTEAPTNPPTEPAPCQHIETYPTNEIPASCTANGSYDAVCAQCRAVVATGIAVPAWGHSFSDGVCVNCGAPE